MPDRAAPGRVQLAPATSITGEFFPVVGGQVTIQMRDRDVALGTRELFVAPRGVEHCPRTGAETAILPSEPGGVASTGALGRPQIAEVEEWA